MSCAYLYHDAIYLQRLVARFSVCLSLRCCDRREARGGNMAPALCTTDCVSARAPNFVTRVPHSGRYTAREAPAGREIEPPRLIASRLASRRRARPSAMPRTRLVTQRAASLARFPTASSDPQPHRARRALANQHGAPLAFGGQPPGARGVQAEAWAAGPWLCTHPRRSPAPNDCLPCARRPPCLAGPK